MMNYKQACTLVAVLAATKKYTSIYKTKEEFSDGSTHYFVYAENDEEYIRFYEPTGTHPLHF